MAADKVIKTHKAQHWIPKSYLRAWTDPDTPSNHKPYVHVFSRDGTDHRTKAPDNIFAETDLYTTKGINGERDLRLEHGLSDLETAFAIIRKDYLALHRQLPIARRVKCMAFVAAMQARTPSIRDHHFDFWKQVQDIGEDVEARMKVATPEQRKRAATASISTPGTKSMSLDDVRKITASPMEHTLGPMIRAQLPYLAKMRCTILRTDDDPGFITSDCPVVWYDPLSHQKPPMYRSPALLDKHLEITMPISPFQSMLITHQDFSNPPRLDIEYLSVGCNIVQELNRRTRFSCRHEFVVRRRETNAHWFDKGQLPPDSWKNAKQPN